MFEKALKVVSKELKEELQWKVESAFLLSVFQVIRRELRLVGYTFDRFMKRVKGEFESRGWDIRQFRNEKNETVLNVFKKIVREIAKEENAILTNDALSRILNYVRHQYASSGGLTAALYPAEAFRERKEWGIVEKLGDEDSCFLRSGVNEGNVDWLISEYENYRRAYFVVFHYKKDSFEGFGRCWAYKIDGVLFVSNFYSYGFEIKSSSFALAVVELLRELFELHEKIEVEAYTKAGLLPIFLNEDGILFYDTTVYESVEEVEKAIKKLKSKCLWCEKEVNMSYLKRYEAMIAFHGRAPVSGLVMCSICKENLEQETDECKDCGRRGHIDDMIPYGDGEYICEECFNKRYVCCERCQRTTHRDDVVITSDNKKICSSCAEVLGTFCMLCDEYGYFEKEIKKYEVTDGRRVGEVYLCDKCAKRRLGSYTCKECGEKVYYDAYYELWDETEIADRLREIIRLKLCFQCFRKGKFEVGSKKHKQLLLY
jgi:hypothetical protein